MERHYNSHTCALLFIPSVFFHLKAFTKCEYPVLAIALSVFVGAGFAEFGENRRFCVPLYMLIFYTVWTRWRTWVATTPART